MTRITLDKQLQQTLHGITEPVEFCDESGRLLGRFFPEPSCEFTPAEPQVSADELARRERENEWLSTDEILERLGAD